MSAPTKSRLKALQPGRLLLELGVVFLGVYAAFLLDDYREGRRAAAERTRVFGLLRTGLEDLEQLFADMQGYHAEHNPTVLAALERGEVPDFGGTIHVAPQYPIDLIQHVLTERAFGLVTLDVYLPLAQYVSQVQRLMYVEEKLVRLAEQYDPAPADAAARERRLHLARRHGRYLEVRGRIAADLAERSRQAAALLATASR